MKNELINKFKNLYGENSEEIRIFYAPGRVNLIGEHTDYNGGLVFPAAVSMGTTVVIRKRHDNIMRLKATDLDVLVEANINNIESYKNLKWGNYQLGVVDELIKDGVKITGADLLYHDLLPHGGGLSSSAAIQVSTAYAFCSMFKDDEVDKIYIAKIGQRSENNYIGVQCGIMDQFASAIGKENHVIFLNCKDLSYKHIPIQMKGYKIVIANTNKKRSLADSKYNQRKSECEAALKDLKEYKFIGEITVTDFENKKYKITNEINKKRATHVVYECNRVLKSIEALKSNDILEFGNLMNQSHNSLKDLYEVTGVELDTLVLEARKQDGCIGSRMTGAGFGGCTVNIVKEEKVDLFITNVEKAYKEKIGYEPSFYLSDIGDGVKEL